MDSPGTPRPQPSKPSKPSTPSQPFFTSQMDAFSNIINFFSTDSTVEHEDVPVEFETVGGGSNGSCIIA
jgi:hypothetical protein